MTDHSPAAAAQHPITPPPELVQQWRTEGHHQDYCSASEHAIAQAARWGADQELEACCSEMDKWGDIHYSAGWKFSKDLRTARRPKPPSLKEQALDELDRIPTHDNEGRTVGVDVSIIRRALEQLDD